MTDPQKNLEQRALDQVNQDRVWVVTNKYWLIAVVAAFVLGFVFGKVTG
jgi:hypothetical protein